MKKKKYCYISAKACVMQLGRSGILLLDVVL